MKQLLFLGVCGVLLAAASVARADDLQDAAKYVKILKTSKSNDERLSAVSDLMLLSRSNFAAIFPSVPDLIDVLKNDKHYLVRSSAARVLAETGAEAKGAIPLCIAILSDPKENPEVMVGAAKVGVCGGNGVKESKEALPILTAIEKAEMAKEQAKRNEKLLEAVITAIGSIKAGTKNK
jgi:HEAT repeat protein